MGDGRYGALKQLTPIKADFGKIAREQEQVEFQKRAEQREIANAKKAEADKKIAEQRAKDIASLADLEKYRPIISGNKSFDEANMQGILWAMNRRLQIYERFQKEPFMPDDEKNKLRLEYSQLGWQAQDQNELATFIKSWYADFAEGLASKKYSEWGNRDLIENTDDIFDNMNLTFGADSKGKGMLIVKNKDGSLEKLTKENLMSSGAFRLPVERFNPEGFEKSVENNLSLLKQKRNRGVNTTQELETLKQSSLNILNEIIRNEIGTKEQPNDERAKMIWIEAMNREESEYNWKDVNSYLKNLADSQYDEKDWLVTDTPSNTTKPPKTTTNPNAPADVQPIRYKSGNVAKYTKKLNGKTFYVTGFTIPKPIDVMINGQKISINSYFIDDDGKIYFSGKGIEKSTRPRIPDKVIDMFNDPDDVTQSNAFARLLKFSDVTHLVQVSRDKANGNVTTTATATGTGTKAWSPKSFKKK